MGIYGRSQEFGLGALLRPEEP